jgi:hypothetical protein
MYRLFAAKGSLRQIIKSSLPLSIYTMPFKLSNQLSGYAGSVTKVMLSGKTYDLQTTITTLQRQIIKPNKNALFIWTTPTTRSNATHGDGIYPGHNFSLVTDEIGNTVCSMSKRPNTKIVLADRERIPDSRFKNQSKKVTLYAPRYTSFEEEIAQWAQRGLVVANYPLFVHIIPFAATLGLDVATYKEHVENIKRMSEPYSLCSFLKPYSDHYVPAGNCNKATEQSIFGMSSLSTHDSYCQEAAKNMVLRYIKLKSDSYLNTADTLGLTHGIESPNIPEDLYRASFTC